MKISLSTRIFVAYAIITVLFGGSVFYLVHRFSNVFDYVVRVHKVLDSTNEDLRMLDQELRQVKAGLSDRYDGTVIRAARRIQEIDINIRLRKAAEAIAKIQKNGKWSKEVRKLAQKCLELSGNILSSKQRLDMASKANILALLRKKPGTDIAYLDNVSSQLSTPGGMNSRTTQILSTEMRGLVLWLQSQVAVLTSLSSSLSRSAYIQLDQRVTHTSTVSLLAPVAALIVSILVMLLILLWLRPVAFLVRTVKKIASGNYDLEPQSLGVREFDQLGKAIFQLANTLKNRETELRHHQQSLVTSERMAAVGKTASVMAHEIRNPLNSISLNLDMLKERLDEEDKYNIVKDQMRVIEREVSRLSAITGEYLKFGRMPQSVMGQCDLVGMIRELLNFMEGEFSSNNILVSPVLPDYQVKVMADSQRMRQALMNIFKNAIDAMKPMDKEGRLDIELKEKNGRVVISIHDNGLGISADIMDDLFEPFASTKPGGTGLGLAFVHQVVTESNGHVRAKNAPEGGTIFYIELSSILD